MDGKTDEQRAPQRHSTGSGGTYGFMGFCSGSTFALRLYPLGMGSKERGSDMKSKRQGSRSSSVPSNFSPSVPLPCQMEVFPVHPAVYRKYLT